ncbi:hypothetical protein HBH56_157250 [Parastagonospora nodorum]|uniref:Secreted protein n=1 Tax=Phaeosphaeria nodorum (strain SN15 / ATCC MYA-4574 / FGSC 10173) TaxID=321614 RepID=A0A7U2F2W4_PHANO|nr:hypothetical protein HBH56_157250 [Parastagonospora nodorum]QRC97476.1 hypothetical protein JI435_410600 [Parastagonospora nodorum SN15]KAH3922850.1 hypothetical protein HBH54_217490 [Parastagonospora nodorum]KAH3946898.1 hypothetical protein HBH53_124650 [Parastagonospora nodorum]KAH3969563.1 hypothetical protein HBH52_172650 [Parastagonospora nodorum]
MIIFGGMMSWRSRCWALDMHAWVCGSHICSGRFSTYHVSRVTTRGRLPRLAGAPVAKWLSDLKVFPTCIFRSTSMCRYHQVMF